MTKERAETGSLQTLLSQVGAGLDKFLKFDHGDALVGQKGAELHVHHLDVVQKPVDQERADGVGQGAS